MSTCRRAIGCSSTPRDALRPACTRIAPQIRLHRGQPPSDRSQLLRSVASASHAHHHESLHEQRPQMGTEQHSHAPILTASEAAVSLFAAINARDWSAVLDLLADDCVLQDLSCQDAAVGRLNVVQFYRHALNLASPAAQLVIEDITHGDPFKAGLTWHVEMQGLELPSSKGLSFVRTNARGRLGYMRENPEHFVKLGGLALPALGLAAPVIRTLGPAALPNYWSGVLSGTAQPADPLRQLMASATSSFVGSLPLPPLPPFLLPEPQPSEPLLGSPLAAPLLTQEQQGRLTAAAAVAATPAPPAAPASPQTAPAAVHASSGGAPATTASGSAGRQPRSVVMRELGRPEHTSSSHAGHSKRQGWLGGMLSSLGLGGSSRGQEASSARATEAMLEETLPVPLAAAPPTRPTAPAAVAAPAAAPAVAPPAGFSRAAELTGVWQKDTGRSDAAGYERGLDLWHLTPLHKAGARLIEGLRINHAGDKLTIYFLTILPESMFKVTEVYPYAQQGSMGRRDMRSGRCSCTAEEFEDGVVVRASWGEPYSGHVREHYQLVAGAGGVQELHVTSIITVGQRAESTLQVYTRSNLSSEQLVKANAARHGNYMDILKRHV